jgi:hypothetical protein
MPTGDRAKQSLRLHYFRLGFLEEALNVLKVSGGVVVVIHKPMMIIAIRGAPIDNLPHYLRRWTAVVKSTSHLKLSLLQGAVDAPLLGVCGTLPIVHTIPSVFSGQDLDRPFHNLQIQSVRGNFTRRFQM